MDFNDMLRWSKEFALVWFFLVFVGILFYAFWPGNKDRFDKAGRMAMEDDTAEERGERSS